MLRYAEHNLSSSIMTIPRHLSVIVATYNRPDALQAVIEGLLAQTDRNFEIIIADDGSSSETRLLIESFAQQSEIAIHHVWQPDEGFQLAAIRNKGIAASTGDYLVFLDGDCVPQRDFVAQHRRLAEKGYLVTGSRILLERDFTYKVLSVKTKIHEISRLDWFLSRIRHKVNKFLPLLKIPVGPIRKIKSHSLRGIKGCNLAVWRDDCQRIHGFDADFIGWGHEDRDFVTRLYQAGLKRKRGFFTTEVFHLWHQQADRQAEAENLQRVENKVQFLKSIHL